MGWRQGAVYGYVDLQTGRKVFSNKPIYGKVKTNKGLKPLQSLTVVQRGAKQPRVKSFRMGNAVVMVSPKGISYRGVKGGTQSKKKRKGNRRRRRT